MTGLLCVFIFGSVNTVIASPVNLPSGIKGEKGALLQEDLFKDVGLSGSFLYDHVAERELEDSVKANFDFIGGKIALSCLNRFDFYTMLGGVQNPEYEENISGSKITVNLEDNFMWGLGASAIVYEWKDVGIQMFGDGNYRKTGGMEIDSLTINGTQYSKSSLGVTATDVKWEEWQIALGISKKFQYFIPYAGIKYSDIKTSLKATVSGTTYDSGSTSSDAKVGPFIGLSILPAEGFSVDISGRFVDEQAVSVAATVRF